MKWNCPLPKIHPTAFVHPTAILSDDVEIGAYSIVEADVVIGPGTVLHDHAILKRYTTIGRNNIVDSHAVLGGIPQDFKFNPQTVSYLRAGDNNIFREGVTISRATGEGKATIVGNRTYWMTAGHAGHDAVIEDGSVHFNRSLSGVTLRSTVFLPNKRVDRMDGFPSFQNSYNILGHPAHPFEGFLGVSSHMGRSDKIF